MDINRDLALRIWDDVYGSNQEYVLDCYGTYICRSDYGDHEKMRQRPDGKTYSYGWDLDHIRPRSDFAKPEDADFLNNLEPVHWVNNHDKDDANGAFTIDGRSYHIVRCEICKAHNERGYGIVDDSTGKRVDWKGVSNRYYQTVK